MSLPNTASSSPHSHSYPKSIFLIMATEFCERFSFCGLRTILSLYLRNILLFGENQATVIYHVFIMLCYFIPILGAALADSYFGRFRTILYFGVIYTIGNILLSLSAVPPFISQAICISVFGLVLIATGTGGIKPCVAAFGGDQFRLPQQQQLLAQFFSIYYFTINCGGLAGMVVTPLLRTGFKCFKNDSCYALGFGCPAGLMILALVLFVFGKPWYKIKSPKENIMVRFIKCSSYALIQKFHSKGKKKDHWLDYALDKYEVKLVNDMKTVLAILFLYIPLPLFWSLNDQQGSRWTFQASRTNGNLLGVPVLPDQVQVINPTIVLVLIPFMEKTIYPCLDRHEILSSPLQRMVIGGFISAMSFVASGIMEIKLEETYPVLPTINESHVNFVNLLPCSVQLFNPFNRHQTLKAGANFVFKKIPVNNFSQYTVEISAPYECGKLFLITADRKFTFKTAEYEVNTIFIYEMNSNIEVTNAISENLQKSLSGKPKLRTTVIKDENSTNIVNVQLRDYHGIISNEMFSKGILSASNEVELKSGIYQYSISFLGRQKPRYNGTIQLDCGGVYSLVIQEHENKINFIKLFMMTPPNSIHVLWLLPQYFLISVGEAIFAIAGLQFTFTQAPKSMKTVTLAAWYLSIALGNLFVIIITQVHLFTSQAYEFFFFAFLVFAAMIVFLIFTMNYKFVIVESDDSTTSRTYSISDETPLLVNISDDSLERATHFSEYQEL